MLAGLLVACILVAAGCNSRSQVEIDAARKIVADLRGMAMATAKEGSWGIFAYDLELSFRDTALSDADVDKIVALEKLNGIGVRGLDLTNTSITDAGVRQLQGIEMLHYLQLANTAVTDEGLKSLAVLNRVYVIDISGTQVSPAGLKQLSQIDDLKIVYVGEKRVELQSIRVIQAAAPARFLHRKFLLGELTPTQAAASEAILKSVE